MFGIYGEDKYRVTSRLTLTAGLRWDPYLPFTQQGNRINCFVPGQQSQVYVNAPKGLIYPGDPGCNSGGGVTTKFSIVEPRIGVAYSLDKEGKSAVRAGFGLYSMQFPFFSFQGFSAPPFTRNYSVTFFAPLDNPWSAAGGTNPFAGGFQGPNYIPPSNVSFSSATSAGLSVGDFGRNFTPGYVEQYTLSFQHAFTSADSVELAYVGTHGVHISQSEDLNLPVYGPGATTANELQRRPYGSEGLAEIASLQSNTTSNYNGLNVTYRHSLKGGLELTSGFNWSKCLDAGSQPPITEASFYEVPYSNPSLFYGRCDFDQNLSFRTTTVWSGPKLEGRAVAMRILLGSWTLTDLLRVDAGQPFSVKDSGDSSFTGSGMDLASRVPGVPLYVKGQLNRAAFTNNAPGTFGDSGRNSFRSVANIDDDIGLMKLFPIEGRFNLTFRAETFNLFNHPNLALPVADYFVNTQQEFGSYTFARDPRIMQFSLNLHF
jgi:hypothetical protein